LAVDTLAPQSDDGIGGSVMPGTKLDGHAQRVADGQTHETGGDDRYGVRLNKFRDHGRGPPAASEKWDHTGAGESGYSKAIRRRVPSYSWSLAFRTDIRPSHWGQSK
jgi:hypothetical protein